MHHKGTLVVGPFASKPYRLTCTCNTAGDFPKEELAVAFWNRHTQRLGPTETHELSVPGAQKGTAQQKPIQPPAPPLAPAGVVSANAKAAAADPAKK